MKLHQTVVGSILNDVKNFGGHNSELKLRARLEDKQYAIYAGDRKDMVLVEYDRLIKEASDRRLPVRDIVPMRLHPTAFGKVMELFALYSGYDSETKMRIALENLDLIPYEKKTGNRETILVLKEDYEKILRQSGLGG
jgi:hypothetical protein